MWMPAPSRRAITRSMPGKLENDPSAESSAMLTRQSNASRSAPAGTRTISRVVPPPFFHGVAASEAMSKESIREDTRGLRLDEFDKRAQRECGRDPRLTSSTPPQPASSRGKGGQTPG